MRGDPGSRRGHQRATDAWLASTGGARTTPGWSISRYSLYYDGGGIGDLFFRKMLGGVTAGVWTASVMLLRVAVWAMDWVAAGRLTEIIGAIPLEVAQLLQTDIVAGLQLRYFALTVMAMVSAWAIARQRLAEAAGKHGLRHHCAVGRSDPAVEPGRLSTRAPSTPRICWSRLLSVTAAAHSTPQR